MQPIRIALIQTHWPGDRQAMMDTYRELVRQAATSGSELVCLQEFTISPYFASSLDPAGFQWAEPLSGADSTEVENDLVAEESLLLGADHIGQIVVAVGFAQDFLLVEHGTQPAAQGRFETAQAAHPAVEVVGRAVLALGAQLPDLGVDRLAMTDDTLIHLTRSRRRQERQ